ncbi:MAG: BatD family protein [Acidobacteriota bacterium]
MRAAGLLPLLFLLSVLPALAGEVRVKATLEPARIGLDETATLSIEAQGGGFGNLRFRPDFDLENFEVVGGPYQYEDVRFGNGSLSRSFRVSWRLRALSTGRARVRDLRIRMQGEVVPLGTREIRVQEEPTGLSAPIPGGFEPEDDPFDRLFGRWAPPWERRPGRPDAFLRAEVRPLRPVVGQQVLYTVYLYTLVDVSAVTPSQIPDFKGFWVRDIPQPQKLPTEMVEVEGRRYGRVVLIQKALFPLRAGPHPIQPTEMDLLVRTIDRSLFGPAAISRPQQVHLRTPAMAVDVQELPEAPPGFTGAVGRMDLAAKIEPAEVRLGESATVTLTLTGEGNLHGVTEPRFPKVPGLDVLPPQQEGDDRVVGTAIRGDRTWSYPVVPERAGAYSLKLPQLTYFDPEAGQYKVASAPPVRLTALPPPPKEPPTRSASLLPAAPERGRPSMPRVEPPRTWNEALPWILAVPSALALVLVLVRRRQSSPGLSRISSREARHRLEQGLREAGAETRPRQLAAKIEESWRGFLETRWEIPPGTPTPRWADLLAERGADPEAARELVGLADDLHYLRYAPQLSSCDTLCREVLERCRRLVRRLG